MTHRWFVFVPASLLLAACATEPKTDTSSNLKSGNADTTATPPAVSCEDTPALPGNGPTLLVLNASCDLGRCVPMDIRAGDPRAVFPAYSGFPLGRVCGASACLRFPEADTLRISEDSAGQIVHTTLLIWTPSLSVGVGAYQVNGGFLGMGMVGRTGQFVPGDAAGWQIKLPLALPGWATPVPASPCQP
jgi:hypothetical protein